MNVAGFLVGAVLVAVAAGDLIWTTLAASGGGGPVTSRLAHWMWELIRTDRDTPRRHRMMRLGGIAVVVVTILLWAVLIWLGWTFVFAAGEHAVVSSSTGQPADWWGRLYFAGTTIATLGPGDLVPRGPGWGIATAVASMSGLLFATLAITYLVPVIAAVSHRRQVALQIAALGDDPYAITVRAHDRGAYAALDGELRDLSTALQRLAQQHLTYPALHYFHDVGREVAGPVQIAALDEALSMLAYGIDRSGPAPRAVETTRAAVRSVLGTLTAAYITPSDDPPPAPDLRRLARRGVETVAPERFHQQLDDLADRRRALLALVEDDGWSWDDVYPADGDGMDEEAPAGSMAESPADEDEDA